jgi:hypothetical protein
MSFSVWEGRVSWAAVIEVIVGTIRAKDTAIIKDEMVFVRVLLNTSSFLSYPAMKKPLPRT